MRILVLSNPTPFLIKVQITEATATAPAKFVYYDYLMVTAEVERVAVTGSVNVPLFVDDDDTSFGTLLKQSAAFGTGGWWLGGGHMKTNRHAGCGGGRVLACSHAPRDSSDTQHSDARLAPVPAARSNFIGEVLAAVPKDKPVVVACQKGLRSLSACEQLVRAGYPTVAWLNGGFDAATKADFDTTTEKDMRYGGVAGVSGMIGWTKVQQQEQVALGGGVFEVLKWVRSSTQQPQQKQEQRTRRTADAKQQQPSDARARATGCAVRGAGLYQHRVAVPASRPAAADAVGSNRWCHARVTLHTDV